MENTSKRRSSTYKGVSKHRTTGRYEAHFWDRYSASKSRARGKQIYIGGFCTEEEAAKMYDRAAIVFLGPSSPELRLNFQLEDYLDEMPFLVEGSVEERISRLRRKSVGFSRGASKYRGVTRHHSQGRWEARLGRMGECKYNWLGVYDTEEEAARAYDWAVLSLRGKNALTNFDISNYPDALQKFEQAKGKKRSVPFRQPREKKTQVEVPSSPADTPLLDLVELLDPPALFSCTRNRGWDKSEGEGDQVATFSTVSPRLASMPGCELSSSPLDFDGNACLASSTETDMLCALLSQDIADLIGHI